MVGKGGDHLGSSGPLSDGGDFIVYGRGGEQTVEGGGAGTGEGGLRPPAELSGLCETRDGHLERDPEGHGQDRGVGGPGVGPKEPGVGEEVARHRREEVSSEDWSAANEDGQAASAECARSVRRMLAVAVDVERSLAAKRAHKCARDENYSEDGAAIVDDEEVLGAQGDRHDRFHGIFGSGHKGEIIQISNAPSVSSTLCVRTGPAIGDQVPIYRERKEHERRAEQRDGHWSGKRDGIGARASSVAAKEAVPWQLGLGMMVWVLSGSVVGVQPELGFQPLVNRGQFAWRNVAAGDNLGELHPEVSRLLAHVGADRTELSYLRTAKAWLQYLWDQGEVSTEDLDRLMMKEFDRMCYK